MLAANVALNFARRHPASISNRWLIKKTSINMVVSVLPSAEHNHTTISTYGIKVEILWRCINVPFAVFCLHFCSHYLWYYWQTLEVVVGLWCVYSQSIDFLLLQPELAMTEKQPYLFIYFIKLTQWPLVLPGVALLPVTVAENSVPAAGTEPRAVLWRIFAKCQSAWKQHGYVFSGEGLFLFSLWFLHEEWVIDFKCWRINI